MRFSLLKENNSDIKKRRRRTKNNNNNKKQFYGDATYARAASQRLVHTRHTQRCNSINMCRISNKSNNYMCLLHKNMNIWIKRTHETLKQHFHRSECIDEKSCNSKKPILWVLRPLKNKFLFEFYCLLIYRRVTPLSAGKCQCDLKTKTSKDGCMTDRQVNHWVCQTLLIHRPTEFSSLKGILAKMIRPIKVPEIVPGENPWLYEIKIWGHQSGFWIIGVSVSK